MWSVYAIECFYLFIEKWNVKRAKYNESVKINSFTYILSIDRCDIVLHAIDNGELSLGWMDARAQCRFVYVFSKYFLRWGSFFYLLLTFCRLLELNFHDEKKNVNVKSSFSTTCLCFVQVLRSKHKFSIICFWICGHFNNLFYTRMKNKPSLYTCYALFSLDMNKST